ncbi:ACP S-malonyltransferase [Silvania hatchlandensis]|uniref:Malonyl CoA-acyl carrier protein transacylase n=1 Tax=Silvania hatchlandensis TaxID=2926469 RepID=A0A9J6PWZ4_9ENTR|nr:ACP S-malonyltransferase [Silvania hatchlandensis]MCU6663137.1 ACP S-malonyltransferase [Silvania hatchlandensis]
MKKNQSVQPLVLLFAGQGNPVIGMGSDLWDRNASTKQIWDCASDITGKDIRRLCQKGPMNRLIQTTVQQVAVTAINVMLYRLWAEQPEPAQIVGACGHSVGEYSALYAAGAITLEALFGMIHVRANIMHDISQRHKGAMLAVKGADYQTMKNLISGSGMAVDISCDNSPCQQVIGGTVSELSQFSRILMDYSFDVVKLGVSGAWHTRLMSEGVQRMRDALAGFDIRPPVHDVMMNVTGQAEFNPEQIRENLSLHLTHTVQWTHSMASLLQQSTPVMFVEMSNKAYLGQILNDFTGFTPEALIHCRKVTGL